VVVDLELYLGVVRLSRWLLLWLGVLLWLSVPLWLSVLLSVLLGVLCPYDGGKDG